MQIPVDQLDADTLNRIIEEFVSREGTDYGSSSSDLAAKVEGVRRQLRSGAAVLCFDENSESCQIVSKEAYRSFQKASESAGPTLAKEAGIDF